MRKKIYISLSELASDLDEWMCYYNTERPHSGKYCYGNRPLETFVARQGLAVEKHNELTIYKEVSEREQLTDKRIIYTVCKIKC